MIAKKACVGQGTFYRNFPSREALVMEIYRHELRQVAESADQLLGTREPDRALREWMDRLARFGMTKAGLADAIRQATSSPDGPAKPGHDSLLQATDRLLRACEEAGVIRPGVSADDLILALGGLCSSTHERLAAAGGPPVRPRHGRAAGRGAGAEGDGRPVGAVRRIVRRAP